MKNLLYLSALLFVFSCSSKSFPDAKWEGKQWTLVEISGIPVQTSGSEKDAHLVFDSRDKEVTGSGGCNRIFGPYEIDKKNVLRFGEMGATRMACQDSPFENKFLETLKSVRYYEYSEGELLLKNGDKKVILKFQ
ncbi:META domain-containing protein [Algoriphagus sp. PAP.12]|uniref:META domain-containing protein n=1 Tax=Algoriphagus sp. PAP.12 TaxID=2996678 RepID=UPI00227C3BEB|nr:META domain-containing protein [Algoriphagus sp. PAP.12]